MKTKDDHSGLPELHLDSDCLPVEPGAEAEAMRRAAALTWLAESDPMDAAPAGSLDAVRAELGLSRAVRRDWRRHLLPLAAAAGWIVAAALFLSGSNKERPLGKSETADGAAPVQIDPHLDKRSVRGGEIRPIVDADALRIEIAELRESLRAARERPGASPSPGVHRPVIYELVTPGASPDSTSRERVLELIASALENELDLRTGTSEDVVVIERGWVDWGSIGLPADTVFRHRAFPVAEAVELGLLAGPGEQFFDPATGWLWTPDGDTGDYLGTSAPAEIDKSMFTAGEIVDSEPAQDPDLRPEPAPRDPERGDGTGVEVAVVDTPEPTGYLVAAQDGRSIVALSNLPPVTPELSLELVTDSAAGGEVVYSLPTGASQSLTGNTAGSWNFSGVIEASSFNQNLTYFSLQAVAPDGEVNVLLEGGADARP